MSSPVAASMMCGRCRSSRRTTCLPRCASAASKDAACRATCCIAHRTRCSGTRWNAAPGTRDGAARASRQCDVTRRGCTAGQGRGGHRACHRAVRTCASPAARRRASRRRPSQGHSARARVAALATLPGPTPAARAASRWLRPSCSFCRRISRRARIVSLSVAMRSLRSGVGGNRRRCAPGLAARDDRGILNGRPVRSVFGGSCDPSRTG
jgi:hypothetical protein